MLKNTAGQKIRIFVYDLENERGKAGIADTITAFYSKDNGSAIQTNDINPTEVSATNMPGAYDFNMTTAEANCDEYWLQAQTTTPNMQIDIIHGFTIDKTGFKLAADGLDLVTKFGQLWRRFFGQIGKTSTQIKHYDAEGQLIMTQPISLADGEKIVGEAEDV